MSTSNHTPLRATDERHDSEPSTEGEVTYADFLGDQVDDDEVDAD